MQGKKLGRPSGKSKSQNKKKYYCLEKGFKKVKGKTNKIQTCENKVEMNLSFLSESQSV